MGEIEKIKDDLFIKKSLGEWIIVRPIKKDLDKSLTLDNINWKHLAIGSWGTFFKLLLVFGLLAFLIMSYKHDISECNKVLESPCVWSCGFGTPLKLNESNSLEVNFYERESTQKLFEKQSLQENL